MTHQRLELSSVGFLLKNFKIGFVLNKSPIIFFPLKYKKLRLKKFHKTFDEGDDWLFELIKKDYYELTLQLPHNCLDMFGCVVVEKFCDSAS